MVKRVDPGRDLHYLRLDENSDFSLTQRVLYYYFITVLVNCVIQQRAITEANAAQSSS